MTWRFKHILQRPWLRAVWRTKWVRIVGLIIVALIIVRLFLRLIVTSYVNKTLRTIPGYDGRIEDVDISLFRGAYVINDIRVEKITGKVPVPFFSARKLDLSVEWRALFHGSVVGEVEFVEPKINFVSGPSDRESQNGSEANFIDKLKELFPLKLNSFDVTDGEVHFRNFASSPPVNIFIDSLYMHGTNFTNSLRLSKNLIAVVDARGRAMGKGHLKGHLEINPYTPEPTFGLDFQLVGVDLTKLNDFFKAYVSIDVESGTFQVYSEMAAYNGKFTGYVKPIFKNMQILDLKKDSSNPLRLLWQAIVAGIAELFTNHSKGQMGTTIPFSGRFHDPHANILATLGGLLKNAFIQALRPGIEGTVSLEKAKKE